MGLHIRPETTVVLKWYADYFGCLVGATVLKFELRKDEWDDYWPTYTVRLKDGREVEIELSADEEGNSAGWLFGLDRPDPPKGEEE